MSKLGGIQKRMMRHEIAETNRLMAIYDKEQRKAQLFKNGITIEDLEQAEQKASKEAFGRASMVTLKTVYAAIALTMQERGADNDEIIGFLTTLDSKIMYAISDTDMIDEVLQETGIELRFDDPICRVHEK